MSTDSTPLTPEEEKLKNFIVEFYGPTNILNDGKTENTLTIGVKNSNVTFIDNGTNVVPDVTLTPQTKISIWFAVSKTQGATNALQELPWAVTTVDSFSKTTLSVGSKEHAKIEWDRKQITSPWKSGPYSDITGWEISPKTNVTLLSGEHISLVLTGLKTSLPDGPCFAYSLMYTAGKENQFPMRQLSTLQKTPVHLSAGNVGGVGSNVGIGKDGAEVTLDVAGGARVRGGAPGAYGQNKNGYFFNSPGDNDSGMSSSADGQLEFYVNAKKAIQINEQPGKGNMINMYSDDSKEPNDNKGTLLGLQGKSVLEFGVGEPKQGDNGKIGYQTFSDGLDIVGAGADANSRKITFHAEGGVNFQFDFNNPSKSNFRIAGQPPMKYLSKVVANPSNLDTGVPYSQYQAAIAGFYSSNYDLNENKGHVWSLQLRQNVATGNWEIRLNMPHDGSNDNWTIDVLFFHTAFF